MKREYVTFGLHWAALIFFLLAASTTVFAAQPGIDADGWGITTYTTNSSSPYTSLESWIRIVDYDGIANDGGSHTVTVTYPDSSVHTLNFISKKDDHTANYELFDNTIPQPIDAAYYSGTYTFRVEDSNGDWSEFSDDLVIDPINPPDETTFLPNFSTVETLTAHFDDVYVNGSLWDDFNSGYDPIKWNSPPSGVTYESGEVRMQKTYTTPSGSLWFNLNNEPALNELAATVRADSIIGNSSRARLWGNFWNDGNDDVHCQLRIHENNVKFRIGKDSVVDGHLRNVAIVGPTSLGLITQGNNYVLSMQWDGTTITFHVLGLDDSVNYSAAYTPPGPVIAALDPGAKIGVARHLVLPDTTPDLSWDAVPEAVYYRVRFYAYNQNRQQFKIFTGYTGDTAYTVPPGILKPNGYYVYRIEAVKDHQWIDDDNRSVSNRNLQFVIAGPQEAQDPFVDLWSIGVETWTNGAYGGTTLTDFFVKVHDAQGVPDNIASVEALFPDGTTEVSLYRDYNDSATSARYRCHYFGPVQPGDYAITVTDQDGHSYSTQETLTPNPINPPVESTLVPAYNALIGGTAVNFDWADVSGAALYELKIYDKDMNLIYTLRTTDSEYALGPGMLAENSLYCYRVFARKEFFEQNTDNGSGTSWALLLASCFFTTQTNGTETPNINLDRFGASVWQAPHPETSTPVYGLVLWAQVADADGVPENIQKVEVTYPDGSTTRLLKYNNAEAFGSNYWHFEYYADPAAIPVGAYTFKAVDFDGHESVLVTDSIADPAGNSLPWATNVNPVNDTLLPDTAPVISWDPVAGASYYRISILDSWSYGGVYWSNPVTATQFTVPAGVLDPFTAYSYRVYSYREAVGSEVDFYSCNSAWQPTNAHFRTGEAPEELQAVAANFGRADCNTICTGNFDTDNDIDGTDLAFVAQNYQ